MYSCTIDKQFNFITLIYLERVGTKQLIRFMVTDDWISTSF